MIMGMKRIKISEDVERDDDEKYYGISDYNTSDTSE